MAIDIFTGEHIEGTAQEFRGHTEDVLLANAIQNLGTNDPIDMILADLYQGGNLNQTEDLYNVEDDSIEVPATGGEEGVIEDDTETVVEDIKEAVEPTGSDYGFKPPASNVFSLDYDPSINENYIPAESWMGHGNSSYDPRTGQYVGLSFYDTLPLMAGAVTGPLMLGLGAAETFLPWTPWGAAYDWATGD